MSFATLFDHFDHVYIVNLADRTDRRTETIAEFARIGLTIPSDKITFFKATRPTDKDTFPTLGTLGNFLSQTAVLEDAMANGHKRILICEDDVHFLPPSDDALTSLIAALTNTTWNIASLGYNVPETPPSATAGLHPWDDGIIGAQMWAIQTPAMAPFHAYLKKVRNRPLGHPLGGAMHFDAAFYMVRKEYPDITHHLASPNLATQRASRTDIHDLRFFDRIEPFRSIVAALRKLKNKP